MLMQILLRKSCVCLVLYVIFRISSSGRLYAEGVRRAVHLYSVGLGWSARGSNVPVWVRGQGHGLGEGGRVLSLSHHGIARLNAPSLSATWLAGPRRLLATAHWRPAAPAITGMGTDAMARGARAHLREETWRAGSPARALPPQMSYVPGALDR